MPDHQRLDFGMKQRKERSEWNTLCQFGSNEGPNTEEPSSWLKTSRLECVESGRKGNMRLTTNGITWFQLTDCFQPLMIFSALLTLSLITLQREGEGGSEGTWQVFSLKQTVPIITTIERTPKKIYSWWSTIFLRVSKSKVHHVWTSTECKKKVGGVNLMSWNKTTYSNMSSGSPRTLECHKSWYIVRTAPLAEAGCCSNGMKLRLPSLKKTSSSCYTKF